MNEKQIEAALAALSEQRPRAPAKSVEDMVRTVRLFRKEQQLRFGEEAPKPERHTEKRLSAGAPAKEPAKDKPKTL